MDKKKLANFKLYLEDSEKQINDLRTQLDVIKKVLHGSPAFNAQFMQANKQLHEADSQLELGWQAYELFKKGHVNPEDKDIDDMLRILEETVNS